MKPQWKKPELIVLLRTRPEESVLAGCKTGGSIGPRGSFNCISEGGPNCKEAAGS